MALTLIMKGGLPLLNGPNINNERGGYLYQMALTLIMKGGLPLSNGPNINNERGATFIKWP